MVETNDILILNVGFIIHQQIGYSREIPLEAELVRIPPDLTLTDVSGFARVTRTPQGLLMQVKASAYAEAECVRCLTEFPQRLEVDFTELYAFTPASITESGLLVPESGKINLGPLVREEMLLSMPIGPLCREDCLGLCPVCGENLNEVAALHTHETDDNA
jgi:uncharacterized protein